MQAKQIRLTKVKTTTDPVNLRGPVLALDIGEKLVGAAISDERLITTKRLAPLKRSNWKKLLQDVQHLLEVFDAQTIVVGLPLRLDGTDGDAAKNVRRLAMNLAKSVSQPVYLQDERLSGERRFVVTSLSSDIAAPTSFSPMSRASTGPLRSTESVVVFTSVNRICLACTP